jgi:predicted enzyme related to lactoylglutathione lyase
VEDIAAVLEKIKSAGATSIDGPMDIPGIGAYVTFNDSEGNRVSMLQPKRV